MAVSSDSMMASVPSKMALATSVTSARVGRGLSTMDLQHLGGGDHRLGRGVGLGDEHLLGPRHRLQGDLHAQVAAGDHDAVGRGDDLVDVVQGLELLDLGDHRRVLARGGDDLLDRRHVVSRAHEGQGDVVHALGQAELQIGRGPWPTGWAR